MRKPSKYAALMRWYTAAMRGMEPAIHEGEPEPGWFKMKRSRSGPWVPVRIWIEQVIEDGELAEPERMLCVVGTIFDEERVDPARIWTYCAKRPISPTEYNLLYCADETDRLRFSLTERPAAP